MAPAISNAGENTPRLAYLVSQFPTVNHTYILREVQCLQSLGFDLCLMSIRNPDRTPDRLDPEERKLAASTRYIQRLGIPGALRAHLATAFSRPAAWLAGLLYPLVAGRGDWRRTLQWFFYFVEAVMVGHWMMRNGVRHLHVHFASQIGLIVTRVFPVTLSITIHGYGELHEDPVGSRLTEKIAASLFVCSISRYGRSQLMRLCRYQDWVKLETTPLGVDPAEFPPRPFRDHPSPFEIVCVGRLASEKAQHVLIAAIHRLVTQNRRVLLRLVGDGPDRAELERDAAARGLSDQVKFEGWLNQDRLRSVYRNADLVALPSFNEGIPVVLMEAMAMEIPCVATHITGIPELIRNGVEGLLVPPSDDAELAAAIATLMDDPALRRRIGAAGRAHVLREYDLERNTRHLAGVFRRWLGGAAGEPAAPDLHEEAVLR